MCLSVPVLSDCSEGSSTIHNLRPKLALSCLGLDFPVTKVIQGHSSSFLLVSWKGPIFIGRLVGGKEGNYFWSMMERAEVETFA